MTGVLAHYGRMALRIVYIVTFSRATGAIREPRAQRMAASPEPVPLVRGFWAAAYAAIDA
jgi:hypothetical protein